MVDPDIASELAAGMRQARTTHRMTEGQWARQIARLVPIGGATPSAAEIAEIETGGVAAADFPASWLVAASRVVGQPVSSILGELGYFTDTLPVLREEIEAVRRELEERELSGSL